MVIFQNLLQPQSIQESLNPIVCAFSRIHVRLILQEKQFQDQFPGISEKKMSFSGMIFKIKMHKILYGLLLLIDQLIGQCSSDTKEEDNLHLYRLPFNGP